MGINRNQEILYLLAHFCNSLKPFKFKKTYKYELILHIRVIAMVVPENSIDREQDTIVNVLEKRVKTLEELIKRLEEQNKTLEADVNSIWIKIDCTYC